MSKNYWGEIPHKRKFEQVIPNNIIMDIERCMDKFCLSEYADESDTELTENIVLPSMDPIMLYAISLHKYANDMTEMIKVADVVAETNLIPPAAPPMPSPPEINFRKNTLNYAPKDLIPLGFGFNSEIPELSEIIVKKMLAKSIATMFAHIGFETTHQSGLDLLTDVLEEFFKKICLSISSTPLEENGEALGFPNIIERVLTEMGMGGIKGLNDYYQNRIIKYINVLQQRCKELNNHYASLFKASELVDIKTEESNDMSETSNPEMHFTSFDGDSSSALESGLQLLNTLEAEEKLKLFNFNFVDSCSVDI